MNPMSWQKDRGDDSILNAAVLTADVDVALAHDFIRAGSYCGCLCIGGGVCDT